MAVFSVLYRVFVSKIPKNSHNLKIYRKPSHVVFSVNKSFVRFVQKFRPFCIFLQNSVFSKRISFQKMLKVQLNLDDRKFCLIFDFLSEKKKKPDISKGS